MMTSPSEDADARSLGDRIEGWTAHRFSVSWSTGREADQLRYVADQIESLDGYSVANILGYIEPDSESGEVLTVTVYLDRRRSVDE